MTEGLETEDDALEAEDDALEAEGNELDADEALVEAQGEEESITEEKAVVGGVIPPNPLS